VTVPRCLRASTTRLPNKRKDSQGQVAARGPSEPGAGGEKVLWSRESIHVLVFILRVLYGVYYTQSMNAMQSSV